eukprot:29379_1
MVVTSGARTCAHMVSFIINLITVCGLCIYVTYKRRQCQYDSHATCTNKWRQWGPAVLIWISFPLIMADPTRHILQNYNIWEGCTRSCHEEWPSRCNWSSNQYKCVLPCGQLFDPPYNANDCNVDANGNYPYVDCACIPQHSVMYLSTIGVLITLFCTYLGFALFIVANLWNANIIDKLNPYPLKRS